MENSLTTSPSSGNNANWYKEYTPPEVWYSKQLQKRDVSIPNPKKEYTPPIELGTNTGSQAVATRAGLKGGRRKTKRRKSKRRKSKKAKKSKRRR